MKSEIKEVNDILEEIKEIVPKNLKDKVEEIINLLNENAPFSLKVSKVSSMLDEISEDVNINPYVRTRIWNVISLLEKTIS